MTDDLPEWLRDVDPFRVPDPNLPPPGLYQLSGVIAGFSGPRIEWTEELAIGWDGAVEIRRLTDLRIEDRP